MDLFKINCIIKKFSLSFLNYKENTISSCEIVEYGRNKWPARGS